MKIKGTALVVVSVFIKKNFGEKGLEKWLNALSQEAREVYVMPNKPYEWYDLDSMYLDPVQKFCDLFYDGEMHGAEEMGFLDAKNSLKGVFSLFLKFGSPEFIIKKSVSLFGAYYKDASAEIINLEKGRATLRIHNFGEMKRINEFTIIGWMKSALELSGAKNSQVNVEQKKVDNEHVIEFHGTWE